MANSTAENKRAIAKITGSDLPLFVPSLISEKAAEMVRTCVLEVGKTRSFIVSQQVCKLLAANMNRYSSPRYTISQYLLLVLSSVNTTELLVKRHNAGKISDQEFIEAIKGVSNASKRKSKSSSKMGGKEVEANGGDRAVNADPL